MKKYLNIFTDGTSVFSKIINNSKLNIQYDTCNFILRIKKDFNIFVLFTKKINDNDFLVFASCKKALYYLPRNFHYVQAC